VGDAASPGRALPPSGLSGCVQDAPPEGDGVLGRRQGPREDGRARDAAGARRALPAAGARAREFWRGFDDEDALDDWLHQLDVATFGSIKTIEPAFDFLLINEPAAPELFLSDEQRFVEARERIIARYVLPATNVAVREIAERAGESDDTTSDHSGGVEV